MRLEPLDPSSSDRALLAQALAPGFGGDVAAAAEIVEMSCNFLERVPRPAPWGSYVAHDGDTPVALGSFKLAPDAEGAVEIAYMTLPALERRGHAKGVIAALLDLAAANGAKLVVAHTLPEENASNRALRSNGFSFVGEHQDPEDGLVWRWERAVAA